MSTPENTSTDRKLRDDVRDVMWLRHYLATHLLEREADLRFVQAMLGHVVIGDADKELILSKNVKRLIGLD